MQETNSFDYELYATVGDVGADVKSEMKVEPCAAYGTISKCTLLIT